MTEALNIIDCRSRPVILTRSIKMAYCTERSPWAQKEGKVSFENFCIYKHQVYARRI